MTGDAFVPPTDPAELPAISPVQRPDAPFARSTPEAPGDAAGRNLRQAYAAALSTPLSPALAALLRQLE